MRVAIDIMGGDNAPSEILCGALDAAKQFPGDSFILVGRKEDIVSAEPLPANVSPVEAAQVMAMDESVENLLRKRDSSIWIATKLVRDGQADAVISAGSTAAQMAVAVTLLGRPKSLLRPAIASILPTLQGGRIFLDVGVNADCEPAMLAQFAQMGAVYASIALQTENPRVALLSNGTEDHKGNKLVQETHQLLRQSQLNFIGNMEGRDILVGNYDVMVTDGFSGNIAIKSIEGAMAALMTMLKQEFSAGITRKIGAILLRPGLKKIKRTMDYQEYGGAPLLGIKGISIVCHGSSHAPAIVAAVKQAQACYQFNLAEKIAEAIS